MILYGIDLTPVELAVLKFVCDNPRGFVFAGDTAQTVSLAREVVMPIVTLFIRLRTALGFDLKL
jgi:hypothetical protein